jgi:hypothetical protein
VLQLGLAITECDNVNTADAALTVGPHCLVFSVDLHSSRNLQSLCERLYSPWRRQWYLPHHSDRFRALFSRRQLNQQLNHRRMATPFLRKMRQSYGSQRQMHLQRVSARRENQSLHP